MTHYQKCKKHRPDSGYKSKTVSLLFREWLDWYIKARPVCLNACLYTYIYHEFLLNHDDYKGAHQHQLRCRVQYNIIERIKNEYWFTNQDVMTHEILYKIGMIHQYEFIRICEDAIKQPKERCNDEPLTG